MLMYGAGRIHTGDLMAAKPCALLGLAEPPELPHYTSCLSKNATKVRAIIPPLSHRHTGRPLNPSKVKLSAPMRLA